MTATTAPAHDVTDLGLAAEGIRRIEWAEREMPVLRLIRERFERDRPLDGLRIGACLHVTTETANLMRTLKAGGAEVFLAASNPLSTKDDVAAALVAEYGIATYARRGEDRDTYYAHLNAVADARPQITMDDGCDLVSLLHSERPAQVKEVLAGTEETTTGVIRLKAMAADGALGFPVVAVNEAQTKHLFDNRYGTGQSTRRRDPAGDQHPHRRPQGRHRRLRLGGEGDRLADGRPRRARRGGRGGSGPRPRGADGRVRRDDPQRGRRAGASCSSPRPATSTSSAASTSRRCATARSWPTRATSTPSWTSPRSATWPRATSARCARTSRSSTSAARSCNLIAEGRLVNLGAAEGHPAAVMDMSFANQALSAEYVALHHAELEAKVYVVPEAIDAEVARLKLAALGIDLEPMTAEQAAYVSSWQHGT